MLSTVAIFTILFGCALARDIRSETTCQTHKRNSAGQRALMHWDIQCDAQGNYLPLQCTVETPKWCACYNKEDPITRPSRSTTSCECHLAKDLAIKANKSPCEIPECHRTGKFEKKQCGTRKQQMPLGVDPPRPDTVQPTADRNLKCP
ncbi:U24-ctenitoxin-Pn1a like protein [Argiope bruennichi]|uniref:U24-ctenitoxin-Pn1a like protein n=1 Tax=Argiope bruennichi TaxID=94029 RepID=A0A8T0EGM6_ARGBR|nr:U24-ctenitoxin-Pn1a like protein [Argiope bruennichi]